MLISDNGVSKVWNEGGWIYKSQPKFMTDNEIWCLVAMFHTGYVPYAEQVDLEIIRMEFVPETPVTEPETLQMHARLVLHSLDQIGIRHGDLTRPNMLIKDNRPYIIDWSESRLRCDPRVDKRPEGDEYWLNKTIKALVT